MFKVTPIGSCRITAPLRFGHTDYGIELNQDRCYGYCHSPAEAVQMARFMQGQSRINGDVWPLISRSHDLNEISALRHEDSDLYVIELASAKEVTIDGVSIQLNYLNSVYSKFFSDPARAQEFWACAEQDDPAVMARFLENAWSDSELKRVQSEVLGKIRLQFVTRDSLRRDIETLSDILPDVLFVSHVDARKPDGEPIRSRSKFIQMVAEEAAQAGCKFYNPTDLMHEFGQTAAIEDESTSLAHFTKPFSDAVMDDWMRHFIAPKTDAAIVQGDYDAAEYKLLPQIAAANQKARFADARARLETLSAKTDCADILLRETTDNALQAQDFFTAQAATKAARELTEDDRNQLILDAGAHGLFDTALDLAARAPGGLKSLSAHTLLRLGDQAVAACDTDNAFEFFLATVGKSRHLNRAKSSLADLALNEEIDLLAELTSEQAEDLLSSLGPIQRLELLRLNGASFIAALSETTPAEDVATIAGHIATYYGIDDASAVMAHWREITQTARISAPVLLDTLGQWLKAAQSAADRMDRVRILSAVLIAAPRFQAARNAMRDLRTELVDDIRAAGREADIDALDALAPQVAALPAELPEFNLWRARLRFGRGDYDTVIELGQSAAQHLPEKINIWVLLMRAADKAGHGGKATEFARKVIALASPETEKLKAEAETLLQTHLAEV